MPFFKDFLKRTSEKKNQLIVVDQLFKKMISQQVQLISGIGSLIQEIKEQNKKLDSLSELVDLMSRYFRVEVKVAEEADTEPPPEPTEHDKIF